MTASCYSLTQPGRATSIMWNGALNILALYRVKRSGRG